MEIIDKHPDCDNEELALAILAGWEKGLRLPDSYITSVYGADPPRRYVGMSSAGRCRRQIVLNRREDFEPSVTTASQLDTFRVGHLMEADTRACLQRGGIPIVNDQFAVHFYTTGDAESVHGHIDGLVYWDLFVGTEKNEPDVREVVYSEYPHSFLSVALFEHKKLGDYPWKLCIGKKGFKRDAPMENVVREEDGGYVLRQGTLQRVQHEYYQQMQCYMLALRNRAVPVTRGIFVGRNPDGKAIAVEVVNFDAPEAEIAMSRLVSCVNDYGNGLIPVQDHTPGKDWNCDYCAYRGACEDLGPGDGPIEKVLNLTEGGDGS